ncbi:MAG: ATP-dependent helicase [Patescibacteria group bacterium]
MIDYHKELNPEQLNVVQNAAGPCLVLAGAGSGKTRAITYRVAYLIEKGVDPKNILLVTFTNKAAREMIERVGRLARAVEAQDFAPLLPWSGTFHHIAYRILKKYAPFLQYKNNFSVLDSADSLDLIKLCLKQEGIDRKQRRFPSAGVIQSIVSYARNAEETIEAVLELKYPNWLDIGETIGRIAKDYDERKRAGNVMDFDDLLVNLHLLLAKSEKVRTKAADQFQYILVDEYQDTNRVQASIIRLLASKHKNILVVGDDAQSIYSFRAADIQNILAFEKEYPGAKIFRLETNYRSTPDILNLANDVISNNVKQYDKNLKSMKERFTKPEVRSFADQNEEAEFIAERILELRDEGVHLKEMSVLFRAAFHSQALEMELTKRGIAYDYRGGIRFFERAHIKDVLAYLRIFNNKNDAIAWGRVLNMQQGIGAATAERIIDAVRSVGGSPTPHPLTPLLKGEGVAIDLPPRAQVGWNDFLQIYETMFKTNGAPAELIRAVLESKYAEYLEYEYQDYRERLQDLEQLAFFAERQSDLSAFLAEATMQENYGRESVEARHASPLSDNEKIILSTVHQAKGLEWEAVFILNLSAGQFPNERAIKELDGIEEERRLFYVALTRAKKYLYLTYPLSGGYSSFSQGPSMFLEEINRDLVSESGFGGESNVFDLDNNDEGVRYEPLDGDKPRRSFLKGIEEL